MATDLIIKLVQRHFVPFFGERALSDITMIDIKRYQDSYLEAWHASRDQARVVQRKGTNRRRKYDEPLVVNMPGKSVRRPSPTTQKVHQATIKRIFGLAVTNGHVASHEIPAFSGIKVALRRRGAFDDAEMRRVLARLRKRIDETIYSHHRAARRLLWLYVRLILLTGLRPGIESDLTFGDFTFKDGEHPHYLVRVAAGKTGPRTVVASAEVGEVLAAIRKQHPCPDPSARLWVKPNGTETIRLGAQFHTVLLSLGLDRDADCNVRSLYSLRHTYATRRLDAQTAIDKLALNMGTSVQMIQAHYGHVQVEHHAQELTK